uniref:Uncharacterized protein n=1 Tax=Arundo donax TaxID=35708 RepID=A0A0A9EEF6_ARUDO
MRSYSTNRRERPTVSVATQYKISFSVTFP